MAAGLDSLAAIELKNAVTAKFGVSLPATVAFYYPTLSAMATFVAGNMKTGESVAFHSDDVAGWVGVPGSDAWSHQVRWVIILTGKKRSEGLQLIVEPGLHCALLACA